MIRLFLMWLVAALTSYSAQASDQIDDIAKLFVDIEAGEVSPEAIKLQVDKLLEPTVDTKAVKEQLDQITETIKLMAQSADPDYDEAILLDALRYNIYHAGVWNDEKPFSYDIDDPLGHNINNKLLSTYLKTRKGNCVSMPMLVYLLGSGPINADE